MATKAKSTSTKLIDRLSAELKKDKDQIALDKLSKRVKQASIKAKQELFEKESELEELRNSVKAIQDNPEATLEEIIDAELQLESMETIFELMTDKNESQF